MAQTVTLQIPELLYQRLVNTARATNRPQEEVMLYALKVGSPPDWDNVPDEFQVDLAALDRMEDEALWKIAQSRKTTVDMERYNILLDRNQEGTLTDAERAELTALRTKADCFMLRKAQAAALLRWRGHHVPLP
ncbi:MAG TPA: hypothetical protein V6D14_27785 [Coleofasciculaceae cyanobacterium]|jgi:hypothetical protein